MKNHPNPELISLNAWFWGAQHRQTRAAELELRCVVASVKALPG